MKYFGQLKDIFLSLSNMATPKTKIMRNISCEELGADFKPPDFTLVLLFKTT